MLRIIETHMVDENAQYFSGACVKGDALPTEKIATGSNVVELDPDNNTVSVKFFDESAGEWLTIGGGANE